MIYLEQVKRKIIFYLINKLVKHVDKNYRLCYNTNIKKEEENEICFRK